MAMQRGYPATDRPATQGAYIARHKTIGPRGVWQIAEAVKQRQAAQSVKV